MYSASWFWTYAFRPWLLRFFNLPCLFWGLIYPYWRIQNNSVILSHPVSGSPRIEFFLTYSSTSIQPLIQYASSPTRSKSYTHSHCVVADCTVHTTNMKCLYTAVYSISARSNQIFKKIGCKFSPKSSVKISILHSHSCGRRPGRQESTEWNGTNTETNGE